MSKSTISAFELFEMFPSAETAREYFEAKRWPDGPVCQACKESKRIGTRKGGFYRCNACLNDFTVRTGTIFERSKVPLHKWLYVMYLFVTAQKGIGSAQLAKKIGVTQKTARFVLQRLREACGNDPRELIAFSVLLWAALDAITSRVFSYQPAGKGQAAAKIVRRIKRQNKKGLVRYGKAHQPSYFYTGE